MNTLAINEPQFLILLIYTKLTSTKINKKDEICKDSTALTTYFYIIRAELSQLIPFFTPCTIEEGHLYATGYMEGKNS